MSDQDPETQSAPAGRRRQFGRREETAEVAVPAPAEVAAAPEVRTERLRRRRRWGLGGFTDWTVRQGERAEPYTRPMRRLGRKWWFKILAYLAMLPFIAYAVLWALFARDLPSADALLNYQPALPTYIRDADGNTVQTFARERRIQLAYNEIPQVVIDAYTSAEDKTFFEHGGIDWPGMGGAVLDYIRKTGSGDRARGGSTITQQVAKNLLLGDEYSISRKIREAFLARQIEHLMTKQQILEIYLNQIFLGRNAYGVEAAARAYFDKDVSQLQLHEAAFLAILPRAPSQYDPLRNPQRALERRNWVLGQMEANGKITAAQRGEAQAQPLTTITGPPTNAQVRNVGGYYMEEVRRQLVARYGESADPDHPNSLYAGGLWIRTAYNPVMQDAAEKALRDGLARFEAGQGWRDPGVSIRVDGDWRAALANAQFGPGYDDWRAAVVLSKQGGQAQLGFSDGSTGVLPASLAAMPKRGTGTAAFNLLRPGSLIAVEQQGNVYALRTIPEISGGIMVEEVGTGRILAMQGGWDSQGSEYNRVTQAQRQPGSTFKPIVYAAALQDGGMTPASIVLDEPFCTSQPGGQKCFRNFSGGYSGPQTMRWGLEQSRNLMTVRIANQVGMDRVTRLAKAMGVGDYTASPYLSYALGAGETTVGQMTHAFATFANWGRSVPPTLIDYVQDRNGRVILRSDPRCQFMQGACNAADWDGRAMPRPPLWGRQVVDPQVAYQVVHMLEGVVQRGTATVLQSLNRPLFGKTGTTTGPTNVWFIGGSQDVVAGIYMGYDRPRPMGGFAQGGTLAAPIFLEFARKAFENMPVVPFRAPPGIRMVRIDRRSGNRVQGSWPTDDPRGAVIWEAFRPDSEPRRTIQSDQVQAPAPTRRPRRAETPAAPSAATPPPEQPQQDSDFLQNRGGIY